MAAISRKNRWWRSKGEKDPRGDWLAINCVKSSLEVAALFLRSKSIDSNYDYSERPFLAAHPLIEQVGGCAQCKLWGTGAIDEPIDVVVEPTNKKNRTVSKKFTDRLWISNVRSVDCSVVHRELFEVLKPYMSQGAVVGDVIIRGGDQIHELVTISDPGRPTPRVRYTKTMFDSSPILHGWAPCHSCGRLIMRGNWWAQYIVSSEYEDRRVRFYPGAALVPPEVVEACGFRNPKSWPGMTVRPLPEFPVALDPMPSPVPATWEELETRFRSYGYELPFPKVCRYDLQSAWIEDRAARLGEGACKLDVSSVQGTMSCEQLARQLFSVQMRRLFEERVWARTENWDEDTLKQYLVDYHAATNGYGGNFPI